MSRPFPLAPFLSVCSKNKLVEDIVGTIMFMPIIYPFEPWRIKHNAHHAHTNK